MDSDFKHLCLNLASLQIAFRSLVSFFCFCGVVCVCGMCICVWCVLHMCGLMCVELHVHMYTFVFGGPRLIFLNHSSTLFIEAGALSQIRAH